MVGDRTVTVYGCSDDGGGGGGAGCRWQFPQPAKQSLRPSPCQQHSAVAHRPHRVQMQYGQLLDALGGAYDGKLPSDATRERLASSRRPDRTSQTSRLANRANCRPQLHQTLVELACGKSLRQRRHQGMRVLPEHALGRARLDVGLDREDAREHARDIAIDQCRSLSVRNRRDRSGRIGSDAGNFSQLGGALGKLTSPVRHHVACPAVKIASSTVEAKTRPDPKDLVERRRRQISYRRKPRHPALPVRDHRGHPCLLQHDLAHPDRVRIANPAPRQISLHSTISLSDRCADLGQRSLRRSRRRGSGGRRGAALPGFVAALARTLSPRQRQTHDRATVAASACTTQVHITQSAPQPVPMKKNRRPKGPAVCSIHGQSIAMAAMAQSS